MAEAYVVRARGQKAGHPLEMTYAALSDSPDEAIALVSRLVTPGTVLEATGEVLPDFVVTAIRLRPGHAKLI